MQIFFARHGESQASVAREISNRGLKHPLTQTGREQAAALARSLEGRSIAQIYSSPVLRAVETAVTVAHHLGVEYEVSTALREVDSGILEGRADEEAWRQLEELYGSWASEQRREQQFEGGECFHDVRDRFVPFIDGLVRQVRGTEASLLCVGHGGIYWMMLPLVLRNIDMEAIQRLQGVPYAAAIVAEPAAEGLVCVEWNGVRIGPDGRARQEDL